MRSRLRGPTVDFLVTVIRQQLAPVQVGIAGSLEALHVRFDGGGRGERDLAAAQDDRVSVPHRLAREVRSLVQFGEPSLQAEVRPQRLARPLAMHAMAITKRKQLHQISAAARPPRPFGTCATVNRDLELAKQAD